MEKFVVLGPKGTFSDQAAQVYMERCGHKYDIEYCPSISDVFFKMKKNQLMGIIPMENAIDGFLQSSLDNIYELGFDIVAEVKLPIAISYVGDVSPDAAKKIFVQFKTKGQCSKFLSQTNAKFQITESNTESYEEFIVDSKDNGALIPKDFGDTKFTRIDDVADIKENYTRFFILKPEYEYELESLGDEVRVSTCIEPLVDEPGLLMHILEMFYEHRLNLIFIMSRPNKLKLGNYLFYIDFTIKKKDLKDCLDWLKEMKEKSQWKMTILGIYTKEN